MTADEEANFGFDIDALIDGGGFASFGHVTSYYNGVFMLHTNRSFYTGALLDKQTSKRSIVDRGGQYSM